jgi:hypothetical protein
MRIVLVSASSLSSSASLSHIHRTHTSQGVASKKDMPVKQKHMLAHSCAAVYGCMNELRVVWLNSTAVLVRKGSV